MIWILLANFVSFPVPQQKFPDGSIDHYLIKKLVVQLGFIVPIDVAAEKQE